MTVEDIKAKYKDSLEDLFLYERENKKQFNLSSIKIKKEFQDSGIGSKVMKDITDLADSKGYTIVLTPSKDFGATSVARLKDFYKRFGFIENKGKNKDFTISDSMYRLPKALKEGRGLTKHTLILEGVKKSKQKKQDSDTGEPKEFEISQLYNYLKAYIIAKFKVTEVKLKDLKLDPDYFKVSTAVQKEKFDASYISDELRKAVAKKFNIKEADINVTVTEIPNRENLFITIEYMKKLGG